MSAIVSRAAIYAAIVQKLNAYEWIDTSTDIRKVVIEVYLGRDRDRGGIRTIVVRPELGND